MNWLMELQPTCKRTISTYRPFAASNRTKNQERQRLLAHQKPEITSLPFLLPICPPHRHIDVLGHELDVAITEQYVDNKTDSKTGQNCFRHVPYETVGV